MVSFYNQVLTAWMHLVVLHLFRIWNMLQLQMWSFKITRLERIFSQSVSSVTQSCPTLWPHELQHARPRWPSPTPGVYPNSGSSSQGCHPAISSSVVPFSSCPQSLPASGSFPMSQHFTWGGQSIGVSALASFLPKNTLGYSYFYHL